ncbi:MAG: hypothetical protein IH789_06030 [Acidobacteria bacterium]|nr:hypothetical protein [Acidobacteriota bacterium]
MKGTARTIFAGKEIESFDLEVIGVLRNLIGPKQDVILVRLLGEKTAYTGVVAGMSGSPVYIEGKLVGALAYRFGAFTREPIAGVTPIESMLRAAQEPAPAERRRSRPLPAARRNHRRLGSRPFSRPVPGSDRNPLELRRHSSPGGLSLFRGVGPLGPAGPAGWRHGGAREHQ